MIIVEGPDGSGKSTLVREITERLGLIQGTRSTLDRDRLHETTVQDSYRAVMAAVNGMDEPLVWDRMFYSDAIYAPIVRDEETMFPRHTLDYLHRLVLAMRAPVIICLPPLEVVAENVATTKQLAGVVENIGAIYGAYEDLVDQFSPHQCIVYDYTIKGNIPRLTNRLRDYLYKREMRSFT